MTGSAVPTLVALNNKGVDLFNNEQDLQSASKYFRAALRIVKKLLKGSIATKESRARSKAVRIARIHRPRKAATLSLLGQAEGVTAQGVSEPCSQQGTRLATMLQLSSEFVSTAPVKLAVKSGNERDDICSGYLSVSISFNLALTYHLLGFIDAPEKASNYFRSAIDLYGIAYSLRLRSPHKREFGADLFGLTDLAIVNNMGVLYHQFGRNNRATACFKKLAAEIRRLDQTQLKAASGFLGNLILAGPARGSLPAAAA